jgi:hypothetical protein
MKSQLNISGNKLSAIVLVLGMVTCVTHQVKAQATDIRTGIMWNAITPPSTQVYYDRINKIDGSPFFNDQFLEAQAVTNAGTQYKIQKAKLDLVNGFLVADDSEGNSNSPSDPIFVADLKSVVFTDKYGNKIRFQNGLPAVNGSTDRTLYQVLGVTNDVKVLKRITKKTAWRKSYGTQEEYINSSTDYYVYKNGSMSELKKDKETLLSLFPDKSQQLNSYIDSHKLKVSKDKDLEDLMSYYSTL